MDIENAVLISREHRSPSILMYPASSTSSELWKSRLLEPLSHMIPLIQISRDLYEQHLFRVSLPV